jgi:hypothetical protein
VLTGADITRIEGEAHVTGLHLSDGRRIEADGLIVTGQFRPDAPLLHGSPVAMDAGTGGPEIDQFGRCTAPGYFAAGNLLRGAETAGWCWAEGQAIAAAIHAYLAGALAPDPGQKIGASGPLAALVPQRIAPGPLTGQTAGLDRLQVQVAAPVKGWLSLGEGGSEIAARTLHARPARRILLPLPRAGAGATVRLTPTGAA